MGYSKASSTNVNLGAALGTRQSARIWNGSKKRKELQRRRQPEVAPEALGRHHVELRHVPDDGDAIGFLSDQVTKPWQH